MQYTARLFISPSFYIVDVSEHVVQAYGIASYTHLWLIALCGISKVDWSFIRLQENVDAFLWCNVIFFAVNNSSFSLSASLSSPRCWQWWFCQKKNKNTDSLKGYIKTYFPYYIFIFPSTSYKKSFSISEAP